MESGKFYAQGQFFICLESSKMISKGFIYHLVRMRDIDSKAPTSQSVPVVNEYQEVFPDDLPSIPFEQEIDFVIDLPKNMQHIN